MIIETYKDFNITNADLKIRSILPNGYLYNTYQTCINELSGDIKYNTFMGLNKYILLHYRLCKKDDGSTTLSVIIYEEAINNKNFELVFKIINILETEYKQQANVKIH